MLLRIAQALFGADCRDSVFDPLVADWQRDVAAARSTLARARALSRGFFAFTTCLIVCVFTKGLAMKSALGKGLAVLAMSTTVLLVLQIGLNSLQYPLSIPLEWRMWIALPMVLPLAVPMAMLPITMTFRARGQLARVRHAGLLLAVGAVTAYLAAALAPLTRGDVRDSLHEAMSQRALANDAAGRFQYPGTVMRTLRPTNAAQRAEFRRDPRYLGHQAEITRPRFGRQALFNAALAIVLGGFGWAIAGVSNASAIGIFGWWSTVWIALILMGGRFSYWVSGAGVPVGGAPRWLPLATFASAAIVLMLADKRRRAPQAPQAP